jgi:hypothetical protein
VIFADARDNLEKVLAPLSLGEFLDEVLLGGVVKLPGDPGCARARLLGENPQRLLLEQFDYLAPRITCHGAEPLGPPPATERVTDAEEFKAKIEAFHSLGYTVRLPDLRAVAPDIDAFARALEFFFHKPVEAAAVFWSRGDAKAPLHYDEYDLIVIQIEGSKRWFISDAPSPLPNTWKGLAEEPPVLDPHSVIEVGPGDLLFIPRGTPHRVEALATSIHISIGFVPLTVRDAIIASLDHLSDLDKSLRETVGGRLAFSVRRNDFSDLGSKVRDGVSSLAAHCGSDTFIAQAFQRRSSRVISDLDKLPVTRPLPNVSIDTRVRHGPSAICHLLSNAKMIDFSYPGGHIYIHRGAEESVTFIAETPEFRVRDIPGMVGDDVRIALVGRFISAGFLVVAGDE